MIPVEDQSGKSNSLTAMLWRNKVELSLVGLLALIGVMA